MTKDKPQTEITQEGLDEIVTYLAQGKGAWMAGGSKDVEYLKNLLDSGLVEFKLETGFPFWNKVRLTDKGWARYDILMEIGA